MVRTVALPLDEGGYPDDAKLAEVDSAAMLRSTTSGGRGDDESPVAGRPRTKTEMFTMDEDDEELDQDTDLPEPSMFREVATGGRRRSRLSFMFEHCESMNGRLSTLARDVTDQLQPASPSNSLGRTGERGSTLLQFRQESEEMLLELAAENAALRARVAELEKDSKVDPEQLLVQTTNSVEAAVTAAKSGRTPVRPAEKQADKEDSVGKTDSGVSRTATVADEDEDGTGPSASVSREAHTGAAAEGAEEEAMEDADRVLPLMSTCRVSLRNQLQAARLQLRKERDWRRELEAEVAELRTRLKKSNRLLRRFLPSGDAGAAAAAERWEENGRAVGRVSLWHSARESIAQNLGSSEAQSKPVGRVSLWQSAREAVAMHIGETEATGAPSEEPGQSSSQGAASLWDTARSTFAPVPAAASRKASSHHDDEHGGLMDTVSQAVTGFWETLGGAKEEDAAAAKPPEAARSRAKSRAFID
eukprot:TRINITY_DN27121_c0_g1_i1.p1 TRINITY_DN27121_c0_g1~~TRINITY_DN27121_c0_g1_i1.p1  ORF type:complete len:475 (+),score=137.26 TRINITY_DN27121_c0_g1_i1:73-1497(+)